MTKYTKLTLDEMLRRKEQILEAKKTKRTRELYVESLDGTITIQEPDKDLARDVQDMDVDEGNKLMVYETVINPPLKDDKMQAAFVDKEKGEQPFDIVDKLFSDGEIALIAVEAIKLAGYVDSVKAVDERKNS